MTTPARQPPAPPLEPRELIDAADVGQMLGVGRSIIFEWSKAGKMPAPVRIGGTTRWRVRELLWWIESGCPPEGDYRDGRKLKWQGVAMVKPETLLATLRAEISRLGNEAAEVADLIRQGKTLVETRARP